MRVGALHAGIERDGRAAAVARPLLGDLHQLLADPLRAASGIDDQRLDHDLGRLVQRRAEEGVQQADHLPRRRRRPRRGGRAQRARCEPPVTSPADIG